MGLKNWEEQSREDFALEALKVLTELASFDEPFVMAFDQLEGLFQKFHQEVLESLAYTLSNLLMQLPNTLLILNLYPDKWQFLQEADFAQATSSRVQEEIHLQKPTCAEIKSILAAKAKQLSIDDWFSQAQWQEICKAKSLRLAINKARFFFDENIEDGIDQPGKEETKKDVDVTDLLAYFEKVKQKESENYEKSSVISDEKDRGYLKQFIHWLGKDHHVSVCEDMKLGNDKVGNGGSGFVLPPHVCINIVNPIVIGFLHVNNSKSLRARLGNFSKLAQGKSRYRFLLLRDIRQNNLDSSEQYIENFKNLENAKMLLLGQQERIDFNFLMQVVIDVLNKDLDYLEMPDEDIKKALLEYAEDNWLIKEIFGS